MSLFRRATAVEAVPEVSIVLAKPPTYQVPEGVETLPPALMYIANVYCCNCGAGGKHHHFDIALPKGVSREGFMVTCPNCEVEGRVNEYGQVWPPRRFR